MCSQLDVEINHSMVETYDLMKLSFVNQRDYLLTETSMLRKSPWNLNRLITQNQNNTNV